MGGDGSPSLFDRTGCHHRLGDDHHASVFSRSLLEAASRAYCVWLHVEAPRQARSRDRKWTGAFVGGLQQEGVCRPAIPKLCEVKARRSSVKSETSVGNLRDTISE